MNFEYDINKSNTNLQKHGIDFESAKVLWDDENMLRFSSKTIGEE
jgi:uncharacterized DUF497 family protein